MSIETVRRLEELAARAWPAALVEPLDGWRLRFNADAVTRRVNSVWPNESDGAIPLEEKLAVVEAFYTARRLPATYQICPAVRPVGLDALLEGRGYARVTPTCVQTGPLAPVLARTALAPGLQAVVSPDCDEAWFAAYCDADHYTGREAVARRGLLDRIAPGKCFARVESDGRTAGVGLGVCEGEWVGVFCMATRPERRRRGVARAVLHALADWAGRNGAARMYLQVMEGNAAALALYATVGLQTLYLYHYREAPAALLPEARRGRGSFRVYRLSRARRPSGPPAPPHCLDHGGFWGIS